MENEFNDLIALWILRLLVNLRGYRKIANSRHFIYSDILLTIGLDQLKEEEVESLKYIEHLNQRLAELEADDHYPSNSPLLSNIEWLGNELSFTKPEKEILLLVILLKSCTTLEDSLNLMGKIHNGRLVEILSVLLNRPSTEIRNALHASTALMTSGLITIDSDNNHDLDSKIVILKGLQDQLSMEHLDRDVLLDPYFHLSQRHQLSRSDYNFIEEDYDFLGSYLRSAVGRGFRGVNILVYGQPGTGKTELARTLAAYHGIRLYEIATRSIDGRSVSGRNRLRIYQLSQMLLSRKKNCAILFDDVDDSLPTTWDLFIRENGETNKAWFNQLLESNQVPAFWISNKSFTADSFLLNCDPAFLRRFDYALELRPPTRTTRRQILNKYLGSLPVSHAWITEMAEYEQLVPAHIEKAVKVAIQLADNPDQQAEAVVDRIIRNTLRVMGKPRLANQQQKTMTTYSLDYLNTDQDLELLAVGLAEHQAGRICLYGPSGTGKTCYAQNIANTLDKPLLLKRVSNILSCWLGGTERNIADMFSQAEDEGAVLLLDEADSFLQNRNNAQRTWEITHVNELLVQMESFSGIFIASTNLIDGLDPASLRRFDVKIKFGYLRPEQASRLFTRVMTENRGSYDETAEAQSRLAGLDNLTPGDFAVVTRQAHVLHKTLNASQFLDALEKECRAKLGADSKPIGFSAWM